MMDAETIAQGLSRFQREAIIKIGEAGDKGIWTSASGINWISVALMMKKYGDDFLLEGVPGHTELCRLNERGIAVRETLLSERKHT